VHADSSIVLGSADMQRSGSTGPPRRCQSDLGSSLLTRPSTRPSTVGRSELGALASLAVADRRGRGTIQKRVDLATFLGEIPAPRHDSLSGPILKNVGESQPSHDSGRDTCDAVVVPEHGDRVRPHAEVLDSQILVVPATSNGGHGAR
jgi:hypothetical protein